jgi:hypothetical protein
MSEIIQKYYTAATPIGEAIINWARPDSWAVGPTSVSYFILSFRYY